MKLFNMKVFLMSMAFYLAIYNISFALTSNQLDQFKSNNIELSNLYSKLDKIYNDIINKCDSKEKQNIVNNQTEWLNHGWDNDVEKLISINPIQYKNMEPSYLYLEACKDRIKYLENIRFSKKRTTRLDTKVGIYGFYIGESFDDALKNCIEKQYYVQVITNSSLPKEFSKYVNNNTDLKVEGDTSLNIDKIEGKYLNLINKNTNLSTRIGNKNVNHILSLEKDSQAIGNIIYNIFDIIPHDVNPYTGLEEDQDESSAVYRPKTAVIPPTSYINECIRKKISDNECYQNYHAEYEKEKEEFSKNFIPLREKIFNSFGINDKLKSIKNMRNHDLNEFIDKVFSNEDNGYDIKSISLNVNNQSLSLYFMNSPSANIKDVLFFICFNATKASYDDTIKDSINKLLIDRYGEPYEISNKCSYYDINNDIIFNDKFQKNCYYFFNPSILTYYIKSANMLYNKFLENNSKQHIDGM